MEEKNSLLIIAKVLTWASIQSFFQQLDCDEVYYCCIQEEELTKAAKRLVFLSDYMQFTTAEMKLNTKTFQVIIT